MSPARQSHPEYERAVQAYLSGRRDAVNRCLEGTKLTRLEHALIEARLLNRSGDPRGALQLLSRHHASDLFFAAELAWVRSHCHNRLGANESSIQQKLLAEELYQQVNDRRGRFLCLYNLSVDYSQLGYLMLEQHYLDRATPLAEGPSESALLHRARACVLSKQEKWIEARQEVNASLALIDELSPLDQQATQSVAADILFRSGARLEAFELLKELSRRTSSSERPRFESERVFLQSLLNQQTLESPSSEIAKHPEFGLKWRLILALQQGDRAAAEEAFHQACTRWPERFERDSSGGWNCRQESERRSIFWSLVSALRTTPLASPQENSSSTPDISGKAAELLRVLQQSAMPLRKEELIEELWAVPYDPTLDSRFYKLVQRLKADLARGGLGQILVQNRAYRLSKNGTPPRRPVRAAGEPIPGRQPRKRMSGSQNSAL